MTRLLDRPLFLLANEFFDALPIRQFVKTDHGWNERMVTVDPNGATGVRTGTGFPTAISVPYARGHAQRMARSTKSHRHRDGDRGAYRGNHCAAKGGAALFVDYGYGDEAAFGETLQAVGRHKFADILERPGEVDLSAHVDFAALASGRAGPSHISACFGPVVTQSELLHTAWHRGVRRKSLPAKQPGRSKIACCGRGSPDKSRPDGHIVQGARVPAKWGAEAAGILRC